MEANIKQGSKKAIYKEKEESLEMERMVEEKVLSVLNGWRVVPDDQPFKKKFMYALAVGYDCLSIWVHKQVIPFIDECGIDEFETQIFPRLLRLSAEVKFTMSETRQELEENIVNMTKRVYGELGKVFFEINPEEAAVEELEKRKICMSEKDRKTFLCLLQLCMVDLDMVDTRVMDRLFFLGHVVDNRIFDFLIEHFSKEQDLLLEILLIKIKHKKIRMPKQQHLTEAELDLVFGSEERKEYSSAWAEEEGKKILCRLLDSEELSIVVFAMQRALFYLEYVPDKEIAGIIIKKSKSKHKAIRMQSAMVLQCIMSMEGVPTALIEMCGDPDDEVKLQGILSISEEISEAKERQEEMISLFYEWLKDETAKYAISLPNVLIAAKKIEHPKVSELYERYCRLLVENTSIRDKEELLSSIYEVFSLFITESMILEAELKQMKIDRKEMKTSLVFPSPEIGASIDLLKYSCENAIINLEHIIEYLSSIPVLLNKIPSLFPLLMPLMKRKSFEGVLESLFQKDPGRAWRYWIDLCCSAEKILPALTEQCKTSLIGMLQPLKGHWAHAVRKQASDTEKVFRKIN
ncbi:hypothetical protein NEFER03_1852 [Nematocida sp. LUAm3]|nr:hypothetical protein NEFER03_1852 [Nematocida sp. LUAm3]KAI5173998.1 hypothetical protein NEFER02_0465 [Nematocida sp. LUAm2]KAI5177258.1 hypothetical protein NEFER01_0533 [Nematocida sp. LUAm1]